MPGGRQGNFAAEDAEKRKGRGATVNLLRALSVNFFLRAFALLRFNVNVEDGRNAGSNALYNFIQIRFDRPLR